MKQNWKQVRLVIAIVGVCWMAYGIWQFYMQHESEQQSRAMLSAPAPSGLPDIFHDAPPPKQP